MSMFSILHHCCLNTKQHYVSISMNTLPNIESGEPQ